MKNRMHMPDFNAGQFRTLLANSIRLDFRGRWHGDQKRKSTSPILRSLIFYVLMGASLSFSLASTAPPFLYTLFMLFYSMTMMAFAVILEFGHSMVSPEDWQTLSFRPVDSATYFWAKTVNLLFYVAVIGTGLTLVPAFAGLIVPGHNGTFPLVFWGTALLANLFSAAGVVLIYTLLIKWIPSRKFKDLLAVIQIGFAFVIFFVYQLIPRMNPNTAAEWADFSGKLWMFFVPPFWFTGMTRFISGSARSADLYLFLTGIAVTVCLLMFSFRKISLEYAGLIANQGAEPPNRRPVSDKTFPFRQSKKERFPFRIPFRNSETAAGFDITSRMLKNDRSVKAGLYPLFGFPLAFLLLEMLRGGPANPFVLNPFSESGVYSSMITFFIFFMVFSFVTGLRFNRDWEGAWIYRVAPVRSPARFYLGVRAAILIHLMLPFFILLGILYVGRLPAARGLQHVATLFLFSLIVFSATTFFIKTYPFTREIRRGERSRRFAALLLVLPLFIAALGIQAVVYSNPRFWWLLIVGSVCVVWILESAGFRLLNRRLSAGSL